MEQREQLRRCRPADQQPVWRVVALLVGLERARRRRGLAPRTAAAGAPRHHRRPARRGPDGPRASPCQQAAEMGLASTAPSLLRAVRAETDPAVLAAVVRTVAARQWEPASTGGIVELRLWARAYAEKHPELRRASGASRCSPGVAGAVPPPSLDPVASQRVPDPPGPGARPAAPVSEARRSRPAAGPRPDEPGAGPGDRCRRSGRGRRHPCAARPRPPRRSPSTPTPAPSGCGSPTQHHVVPRADDPHYLAALLRVATDRRRPGADLHGRRGVRRASGARGLPAARPGSARCMPPLARGRAVHRQVGVLHAPRRRRVPRAGDRPRPAPRACPVRGSSSRGSAAARAT